MIEKEYFYEDTRRKLVEIQDLLKSINCRYVNGFENGCVKCIFWNKDAKCDIHELELELEKLFNKIRKGGSI